MLSSLKKDLKSYQSVKSGSPSPSKKSIMATTSTLSASTDSSSPRQQQCSSQQQSPRNTASAGNSTVATSCHVQWGVVEVSKQMQDGEKFIKWEEVSFFFHYFLFKYKNNWFVLNFNF